DGAFEFRIVQSLAEDIEQVIVIIVCTPGCAHAEIIQLATLVGRVPTLGHAIEVLGWDLVELEPLIADHKSLSRNGVLLVLALEMIFTHSLAHFGEYGQRLPLGMQDIAL